MKSVCSKRRGERAHRRRESEGGRERRRETQRERQRGREAERQRERERESQRERERQGFLVHFLDTLTPLLLGHRALQFECGRQLVTLDRKITW